MHRKNRKKMSAFDIGLIVALIISLALFVVSTYMWSSDINIAVKIVGIILAVISGIVLFGIIFILAFFYMK